MSVAELRRTAPPAAPASPERAALAEAIAERDAATGRIEALRGAVERARSAKRAAEEERDAANKLVETARVADARATTDAMIAGAPSPAPTLPAARAALQHAEDALASAQYTHDAIGTEIAELVDRMHWRDGAVDRAVAAALLAEAAPAAAVLVAGLEELHRQMVDKHLALNALIRANGVATRENGCFTHVASVTMRFESVPSFWNIAQQPGECPTLAAWQKAIAELKVDAACPLPQ
jgi:RNA 3'-terminal phosphate cyclase